MKYLLHFTIMVDVKDDKDIADTNAKILAQCKPELGAMIAHRTEFIRPPQPQEE